MTRELGNVFKKGKDFKMDCYNCKNEDFKVTGRSKSAKNDDGSICYDVRCECTQCGASEAFFN